MNEPVSRNRKSRDIALRDFPYPYRAALAVTGDLDDLSSRGDFLELVRFMGTRERTSIGVGLGLEISHSFWFYDAVGECDFTVFEGTGPALSSDADLLERLIRSGHLDIMHTYGDFSHGGFLRAHAELARDYLLSRGLQVPVWVNHGGPRNTQMIGELPEQRGDDPGALEYHADVMFECGVRFVERFDITHTVGQDARSSVRDRLVQTVEAARYLMAHDPARASGVFGNRLLTPCRLGDGSGVHCFRRFIGRERGMERAGSAELASQLAPRVLRELISKRGWMSVYTHPWRNGGRQGLIDPRAADALRGLAAMQSEGSIYVTTTSKLLRLNLLLKGLEWRSEKTPDGPVILAERVRDDVNGSWLPAPDDLAGLTFYTPDPHRTRVFAGSAQVARLVTNPADETGAASVSVPLLRLPYPDLPGS